MKELSIEQKAKLYNEAVINGSRLWECGEITRENYEYIFPELKESEDERIRKALIDWFSDTHAADDFRGIAWERIVAWLEKQGEQKTTKEHNVCDFCEEKASCINPCPMKLVEQKPTQEIEPTPIFKIGDILKRKGKDYTFRVDRIQGGYYHCDRNHGAFFPIEEQGNWELVEQKPAWSKEDEEMLKIVIKSCEQCGNEYAYYWLKSIKDRVQPMQEWSEEDEIWIDRACMLLDELNHLSTLTLAKIPSNVNDIINHLKSFKDRYTWKPSEKQLNELHKVITNTGFNPYVIKSLYDNLKKLREE